MKRTSDFSADSAASFRWLNGSLLLLHFFFNAQTAILPLYLLEMGGNAAHVGAVSGIGSLSALLMRAWMGKWVDVYKRTSVFCLGIVLYFLATVGYLLSAGAAGVLVSRALCGIGMCAVTSALVPIACDLCPQEPDRAIYTVAFMQTIGGFAAPQCAILFAYRFGYRMLYTVTAVGYLAALLAALLVRYDCAVSSVPGGKTGWKWNDVAEWSVICPSVSMLFFGVAHCAIIGFVAGYGVSIGVADVGFFTIIIGLVTIVFSFGIRHISLERQHRRLFLLGISAFVTALLLFLGAQGTPRLALAAVMTALALNTTQPILNALTMKKAGAKRAGGANALYYFFWDFGYGFGSILLGFAAEQLGYHAIYQIGMVSLIPMSILYLFASAEKTRQRMENA